jgi:hypothetical protein
MLWLDMVNILMGHGEIIRKQIKMTLDFEVVNSRIHLANRPV